MVNPRFVLAALWLVLLVGCTGNEWHPKASESRSPLLIEVIGGVSMKQAMIRDAGFFSENAESVVKLEWRDDRENLDAAREIAHDLRDNPNVLAVVGHSKSGTTLAALPFYAQAGIPVLMPAATSPYVLYGVERDQPRPKADQLVERGRPTFRNAFRLLPSDVPDQVTAIRLLVDELNREKSANPTVRPTPVGSGSAEQATSSGTERPSQTPLKVMVICDITRRTGADIYTIPMCQALREDPNFSKYLQKGEYRELELDTGDIYGIVTQIHAVKPDVLVLMAYPDLVGELLQELKERADAMAAGATKDSTFQMKDYKVIVSDASSPNMRQLAQFGALLYLTSMNSPHDCDVDVNDYQSLVKAREKAHAEDPDPGSDPPPFHANRISVDERFTFDALYILHGAIEQCGKSVDRGCIMQNVKNAQPLRGVCEDYTIIGGERRNAAYYIYSVCKDKKDRISVGARWSVAPDKRELDENTNWCKESNP